MAWEYLKTEPFYARYKIAAAHLPKEKIVVDLNCGEPIFKNFYIYKKYFANDVFTPDDISGINFRRCTDEEVDVPMDILTLFGYGGGEFTGEPLESKTAGESLIRLAEKYHPEYIVIEMAQRWEDFYQIMTNLKNRLIGYRIVFEKRININPVNHYHDQRLISILKLHAGKENRQKESA